MKKLSSGSGKALKGAVFYLYTSKNQKVGEYTTDDKGCITVDNLPWNSYFFIEQTAPEGYELSDEKIGFSINEETSGAVSYTHLSHNTHVYGILELAKREGLSKVFVHCFLDGRDTPTTAGKEYIKELNDKMKELGVGQVASVMGRYYAMDRDNRWDRVERAYNVMTKGEGNHAEDVYKRQR